MSASRVGCVAPVVALSGAARSRGGFTLIEVLMGVLVLGLGLLGLAAVFPAVVLQQKAAADAVEGDVAATTAEAVLRGSEVFGSRVVVRPPGATVVVPVLPVPAEADDNQFAEPDPDLEENDGEFFGVFETMAIDENYSPEGAWNLNTTTALTLDPNSGSLLLELHDVSSLDGATRRPELPVTQRLVPAVKRPENGTNDAAWREIANRGDEPRFVWDFVTRRSASVQLFPAPAGDRELQERRVDGVQAAIFVRRIDTGIRGAGDAQPLSRRLSDPASNLVPVGETADGLAQNNGTGRYSVIREAVADRTTNAREMDVTNIAPAALRSAIAQVGQKFIVGGRDAEPGVYEVRSVRRVTTPGDRIILEMDKALPLSRTGDPDVTFLYTPQIPVAVRLVTIDPKRGQ
jgi:prepilin-type N-terminal cleavage/methylation domain-containing protein